MVVRPEDCVDGNIAFKTAVKAYTDQIDAYLKANWYNGCKGIQILLSHPKLTGRHDIYSVRREVEQEYSNAGWQLKFDSDPREPGESSIFIKLA